VILGNRPEGSPLGQVAADFRSPARRAGTEIAGSRRILFPINGDFWYHAWEGGTAMRDREKPSDRPRRLDDTVDLTGEDPDSDMIELEEIIAEFEARHEGGPEPFPRQLGDFRLLGTMGETILDGPYEAEQISTGRRVVLKVLPGSGMFEQEDLDSFQRQAQAIADLQHPAIVPILAFGTEKRSCYYAQPFIEGRSVRDLIREAAGEGRRVDEALAGRWCVEVAEALHYAHEHGVIHGNVKPSNIMVDGSGRVRLMDFHILLPLPLDADGSTFIDRLVERLSYISPGYLKEGGLGGIDRRTDVYSLGATLYELLTGARAFEGERLLELVRKIQAEDPIAPRQRVADISPDLEAIVLTCMAKKPSRRFRTARKLAERLRASLA
jgi:serine/threonine protein kinase